MVRLIDTHCHLYSEPLGRDVTGVLDRAARAGVRQVVVPAYDNASWQQVADLARHPGVAPALGLHPWVAAEELDTGRLREWIVRNGAVAVGEIGLDFKIDNLDQARQVQVLQDQLFLADELDLPVILHCRGAFEELCGVLQNHGRPLRGVIHAYSRGPELARRFVELGLHIAFGGVITRPQARRARRSAAVLPAEHLLLETDAPSIGLHGIPATATEPQHIQDVAGALAEIRGTTVDEIGEVTTANAQVLFGLPDLPTLAAGIDSDSL